MYNYTPKKSYLLLTLLTTLFVNTVASQIVIGTPTLGFSQACASSGFNTYNVSFTFFPVANLQAGNTFIIEMSDPTGNFAGATTVKTLTSTTSPVNTNFQLPTNTAGEGYRLRVRSTAPVATSPSSVSFPAYYAIHNQPFSINNNSGSITVCEGSTFNLQIDSDGTPASPLFYPGLNYKWYRNFAEIIGQTGPSIPVTQSGNYYVIVDYGSCIMNSYSNIVAVNIISGFELTINTTDSSDFICEGSSKTLVSSHQDTSFNYQWYRNNVAISGANAATYNATLEGTYKLIITVGSCVFESNTFFLELIDLQVSLNTTAVEILIPGTTLQINGITNAINPTFQWKKNGVNIPGATSINYTANDAGIYSLTVTETQGCSLTTTVSVEVIFPNSFEVVIASAGDYQQCISTEILLNIVQFDAFTNNGVVSLLNNNYGYSYQWFKNNQPISGATATTLTVNQTTGNGTYHLVTTIPGIATPVTSNSIIISLGGSNPAVITQTGAYCNSTTTVTFNSNYTGTQYTYQWYRNGNPISGATSASYATNQEGNYYVIVTNGGCPLTSNTILVSSTSGTITINNPAFDIILPGEEKILTTTTSLSQPTYQWYRNNILISGATSSSYTATLDGIYKVVATQGTGCALQAEASVTLGYPDSFNLTINVAAGYQNCVSTTTSLAINSFVAQTSQGNSNVNPANPNYSYQWLFNGVAIPGATSITYPITNASQNGTYQLTVNLPNFGTISSNNVAVALAITAPVVTVQGSLCGGNSVQLISSETNAIYSYNWYKNGVIIAGANQPTYTTFETGAYHLVLSQSSCSASSNSVFIEESSITATLNVSSTEVIIPGQTRTLTVTTNAINPTFQWYRNNIIINGATASTYVASQFGTYKVVVTQSQDCVATQEAIVNLIYPDSFTVTIAPNSNYSACFSDQTVLNITSFDALTTLGTISILNNDYGYIYQWYKNGILVVSSNQNTLPITSLTENGVYELRIVIPEFNLVISNTVTITLGLPMTIEITPEFTAICENGGSTLLFSNVTDSNYVYRWYSIALDQQIGNQSQITISEAGDYYLEVEYNGCVYLSNTVTIQAIDETFITISEGDAFELFEGASVVVYATGGDSYQWFLGTEMVGVGSSYTVVQPGIYTLKAMIGNCEIVKTFVVTLKENNSFVIPNFVSINNDGRNDYWEIPEKYTNKEDVEVIIYSSAGKVLFRARNYQNNWPNENYSLVKTDPVVYYTISENDEITKKGSITIIE
ncbi:T9SS type B sorting domain-containing protein [Flavobacterium orientale]|uniref:Ig-like domain-containing protein n=1 Tax=Flavobacterium orientale TaxID=1756020 RepID=A0A916XYS6_9FLAO|nr:gliding motility-associated C-terminal domain-containing protein [Flavobacterium orientale]GGD22409.1 hypothetical protein GCM10011343_10780 [Flavobacterium orientale]